MTKLTEENLKNYFLGKLSQAEGELLEEEIALNERLTMEAQILESELLDAYLRENLSASDSKLFESVYLTTEARREKLQLANSLWKIADKQKKDEIIAATTPNSSWFSLNFRRVAFAGAAAVLLAGAFVIFLVNSGGGVEMVQQQNSNDQPIPTVENQNIQPQPNFTIENRNTSTVENLISRNRNVSNSNFQQNKDAAPKPSPLKKPAPVPASFSLLPGSLRDEGEQSVKIAPDIKTITLRLNLPKDAVKYQIYTATVKTADGETIFTSQNLKSLNLILPAAKFENRTHIIFLEGQNAQNPAESIAEYTFRVRR